MGLIENYIKENGSVTLDNICNEFNVSKVTLRRYLDDLIVNEDFVKFYGGVKYIGLGSSQNGYSNDYQNSKVQIGELASSLVNDGETIFIDSGSTAKEIIPFLANKKNIIVITNSIDVLHIGLQNNELNIISLGGKVQHSSRSLAGHSGMSFYCSKAFISAESVNIDLGVGNTNFYDSITKRVAIENSEKAYLVVDEGKFSTTSYNIFAKLKDFKTIITNTRPSEKVVEFCQMNGIELVY